MFLVSFSDGNLGFIMKSSRRSKKKFETLKIPETGGSYFNLYSFNIQGEQFR